MIIQVAMAQMAEWRLCKLRYQWIAKVWGQIPVLVLYCNSLLLYIVGSRGASQLGGTF